MANDKPGSLTVLSEFNNSRHKILSPAVGYYSSLPQVGAYLPGGSRVGKLTILNSVYNLYLPEDIHGMVVIDHEMDFVFPVEYGQELFHLNLDKRFLELGEQAVELKAKAVEDAEVEEGYVVRAFTTGIFYDKPSPDSPPFVAPGQEIEKGKALGLIEVMKTFNHIVFHGTDKSDTGIVKKVYVKDAQEVKSGQPLFLIL